MASSSRTVSGLDQPPRRIRRVPRQVWRIVNDDGLVGTHSNTSDKGINRLHCTLLPDSSLSSLLEALHSVKMHPNNNQREALSLSPHAAAAGRPPDHHQFFFSPHLSLSMNSALNLFVIKLHRVWSSVVTIRGQCCWASWNSIQQEPEWDWVEITIGLNWIVQELDYTMWDLCWYLV